MAVADSAVGAMLVIPQSALNKIANAEKAIQQLADASARAAKQVSTDWGSTAITGLDAFIAKLATAREEMAKFGNMHVTLNTQSAIQAGQQLAGQMQKTTTDVSQAIQNISMLPIDTTSLRTLADSALQAGMTFKQLEGLIKNFEHGRSTTAVESPEAMAMNNAIAKLKEYMTLKKKSEEQLTRVKTDSENAYLNEQKRLMTDLLNLRKQINAQSAKVQSGRITGNQNLKAEEEDLRKLFARYQESYRALQALNAEKGKNLGQAARTESEVNAEKYKTEVLKQQIAYRQKLSAELTRANELTAQGQQGKTRLGTGEEAAIQRQLNSDYKAMLKIIREQGELKAKVAAEGRQMTQAEIGLVAALAQRYRVYYEDVNRIAGAYRNMASAAQQNFQADKSEQLARNAVMLADAQNKAAQATDKTNKALHDTSSVMQAYNSLNAQIERESNLLQQAKDKALQASAALQRFNTINPTFNYHEAVARLEELRAKIEEVKTKAASQGPTKGNITLSAIKPLQAEYDALSVKVQQMSRLLNEESLAMGRAYDAASKYTPRLTAMREESDRLSQKIERLVSANNAFNNELAKGNNVRSLVAEYKKLIATIEQLGRQMSAYRQAGGNTSSVSYQAMSGQLQAAVAREKEIRMMSINEVEQYRAQRAQAAYQADLNAFVQAEAQKTAAAKQAAAEQSTARAQAYQKYMNSYEGAMRAYEKLGSRGSGNYADTFVNRERVIKQLEASLKSLSRTDADYNAKVERLSAALRDLGVRQKEVNAVIRQQPKADYNTAKRLVDIANTTKSLRDLQAAYNAIKAAMSGMAMSNPAFKKLQQDARMVEQEIQKIKRAMGEFKNQSVQTSNVLGGLQSRIAAAFSVAGIINFAKKVVEVRAQFELQRVALGAIIQDTDKANQIFSRVQQMALESPFTIMGLEKATKQIAAFGFEADKLVPTMKMFADVAAGLGAPIDRLVLVMGHLKARNFLEGMMVRQFTNMGFNVLGELADYYTELEGKMVSVGEVQERVKKKMVSFEDVEQVLKRVTSAGGMFYDMQRKQSNSIWGQMQRIQDATDLMLNDIGRSNEGAIKWFLSAVRSLIIHWRDLKPYIVGAISAMGTYMTVAIGYKVVVNVMTGIRLALIRIRQGATAAAAAQQKLNITMMSNPYAAVAAAIVGIVMCIADWISADDELTEGLERVKKEGMTTMGNLIVQYRQLAETIKDVTTPYEDYQQAMKDLQRVYKEILPDRMLELDYIKNTTDGYREAIDAIKAYSAEKIKENMRNEVENLMGDDISEAIIDSAQDFTIHAKSYKKSPLFHEDENTIKGAASNIMHQMIEELKSGEKEWTDFASEFIERMEKTFDVNIDNKIFKGSLEDITDVVDEMTDKFGEINTMGIDGDIYSMDAQPTIKGIQELDKQLTAYKNSLRDLYELNKKNKDGKLSEDEYEEAYRRIYHRIDILKKQSPISLFPEKDENSIISKAQLIEWFDILDQRLIQSKGAVDDIVYKTNEFWALDLDEKIKELKGKGEYDWVVNNIREKNPFLDNWIEEFYESVDNRKLTDAAKQIINIQDTIIDKFGVQKNIFDRLVPDSKSTFGSMAKDATTLVEQTENVIKSMKKTEIGLIAMGYAAEDARQIAEGRHGDGRTFEEYEKYLEVLKAFQAAMGAGEENKDKDKDRGRQEDAELKKWQNIKKAIEDTNKAYEKYRKSFTESEANIKIEELYGKAFKELGVDIREFYQYGEYSAEGLKKALESLLSMTKATTKERKNFRSELQRDVSDTQIEIEIKLKAGEEKKLKEDIDNLFSNYELTKDLSELGLNIDLVYMVGGKPMTLQGIQDELARLRHEATNYGSTEASENKLKELEAAEKKLTQVQEKEQLQRLKNYKKYLAAMYSDNAKKMIESYTTMALMERDFNKYLQTLIEERNNPATSEARKKELDNLIAIMEQQAHEASEGIKRELEQAMAKADWERFKGSDIFSSMYEDVSSLTKGAIDKLITKLEAMRDSLQKVANIDPKAVREVTKYIEKLRNAKIELTPYTSFKDSINALEKLQQKYGSLEAAQMKLSEYDTTINTLDQQVSDLETLIELKNRGEYIDKNDSETSKRLLSLQEKFNGEYEGQLEISRAALANANKSADELRTQLTTAMKLKTAYDNQIKRAKAWQEQIQSLTDSVFSLMDAFGMDIDEGWKQLANAIINAVFQSITLSLQLELLKAQAIQLGVAFNAALGVIGWISMALSAVVGLFSAIFAIHDNRLQKQIEDLQEEVDLLSESFENLQDSIEQAFNNRDYQGGFNAAKRNLADQRKLYQEMIRLEEAKKKTDDDRIKEYRDKLQELADAEAELYEKRHERYGSTNDPWDEANNWVDAWLEAYKENGDGLDALNESWDEFYENLVKKQAASRVLGQRMDKYIKEINEAIDKNLSDEFSYIDLFRSIGERMKAEFESVNADLRNIFEYAGLGVNGELLLSDLQQGIQNITEPQAAAIESYLNSIRFAVHRHTEQLDQLISSINAQYGTGENNPMLTELRGIRGVLDNIYMTLRSVVTTKTFGGSTLRISG